MNEIMSENSKNSAFFLLSVLSYKALIVITLPLIRLLWYQFFDQPA